MKSSASLLRVLFEQFKVKACEREHRQHQQRKRVINCSEKQKIEPEGGNDFSCALRESLPDVGQCLLRLGVNPSHKSNLMILLTILALIDKNRISPDYSLLVFETETPKSREQAFGYIEEAVFAEGFFSILQAGPRNTIRLRTEGPPAVVCV